MALRAPPNLERLFLTEAPFGRVGTLSGGTDADELLEREVSDPLGPGTLPVDIGVFAFRPLGIGRPLAADAVEGDGVPVDAGAVAGSGVPVGADVPVEVPALWEGSWSGDLLVPVFLGTSAGAVFFGGLGSPLSPGLPLPFSTPLGGLKPLGNLSGTTPFMMSKASWTPGGS